MQIGFESRHLEMLDDIILENTQAVRQATIYSSVLSGLMDARGTIVNNNMWDSLVDLLQPFFSWNGGLRVDHVDFNEEVDRKRAAQHAVMFF